MTTTRKKIKAMKTGAEYGVATGGGASMLLNILGFCVSISNPLLLGIAGLVGGLFCCYGYCQELSQEDEEDIQKSNQKELRTIERKIENIEEKVVEQFHHSHEDYADRKDGDLRLNTSSIFSPNRDFIQQVDSHHWKIINTPAPMTMESTEPMKSGLKL